MRFAVITSILVLLSQLNSPAPILDTQRVAKANSVVSSFVSEDIKQPQFPDRSAQIADAHQHDINKEIAAEAKRLQDAEALRQAQAVNTTPVSQNTPVNALNGSCVDWIRQAGVTDIENAYYLIMKESGCNPKAINASSGACGIPQALPCSKLGTTDPVEQIRWMQNYCISRYGSWAGAVAHSKGYGWY